MVTSTTHKGYGRSGCAGFWYSVVAIAVLSECFSAVNIVSAAGYGELGVGRPGRRLLAHVKKLEEAPEVDAVPVSKVGGMFFLTRLTSTNLNFS